MIPVLYDIYSNFGVCLTIVPTPLFLCIHCTTLSLHSVLAFSVGAMEQEPSASSVGEQPRKRHAIQPPGGFRQKAKWGRPSSTSPTQESALAKVLITNWSWGDISAPMLQDIAWAAEKDGNAHPDVRELAKLGTYGKFPGNCNAELLAKLRPVPILAALSTMQVVIKKPPAQVVSLQQPVLLPHQLFAALYHHHKGAFIDRICGGTPENIGQIWSDMQGHPAFPQHPLARRPDHQRNCIPIALHGDGVAISGVGRSWGKSVDVYSWASLLGKGSTVSTNFLVYLLYWKLRVTREGMDVFDKFSKVLAWSLYWLFLGVWPRRDADNHEYLADSPDGKRAGQPLADGDYAVLWCLRGDMEHVAKALGLNHPGSLQPCPLCRCNTTTIPWTDGRPGAAWMSTIWTHTAWVAAHPERHRIFRLPGVGVLTYIPDILHTMHLGCYQYVFGSILQFLTDHRMGGNKEETLSRIWNKIKEGYSRSGATCKFNELKRSMFVRPDDFPSLKGKGAEVKQLAGPLLSAFVCFMDASVEVDRQMRSMLQLANKMEAILELHKDCYKFPLQVAAEFRTATQAFFQLNTALGNKFHYDHVLLFNHTIKFHALLHLGLIAAHINPRLGWCYAGEDFMHRVKQIVQSSQSGTAPPVVVPKVMKTTCRDWASICCQMFGGGDKNPDHVHRCTHPTESNHPAIS